MTTKFALIALPLMLAACVSNSSIVGLTAEEAAVTSNATSSATEGQKFLSGTTAWSLSAGFGTQIEYLAPDGTSDLWFPGNTGTVPGQWKVVEAASGETAMCFLYSANSYDVIARQRGGSWECRPLQAYLKNLFGLVSGDPFRLANGKIPFVLAKEQYLTLDQAQEQAGSGASQSPLDYKFNSIKFPQ
jgi:hypothetical protein